MFRDFNLCKEDVMLVLINDGGGGGCGCNDDYYDGDKYNI